MRNKRILYIVLTFIFSIGFYIYDNYSIEGFQDSNEINNSAIGLEQKSRYWTQKYPQYKM